MEDCDRVLVRLDAIESHVDKRIDGVEAKIDEDRKEHAQFRVKMGERMARLETSEQTCPIHKINGRLAKVEEESGDALKTAETAASKLETVTRYLRVTIGAVIVALVGAALDALGISHRG